MVASNRLQRWAREKGKGREEPDSIRYEAYMALLDHRIRRAWVSPLFCTVSNIYACSRPSDQSCNGCPDRKIDMNAALHRLPHP